MQLSGGVKAGEVLALRGPSGCGKTTFLNVLAGFHPLLSGEICLQERNIAWQPPYKRKIAYVFQSNVLFEHLNVLDNVAFALRFEQGMRGLFKSGQRRARALSFLQEFSLEALAKKWPQQLSGGEQKRIALLRSLIVKPELLLLDEAFAGLDRENKLKMTTWIERLIRQINIPVILVSHSEEDQLALAHRVVTWQEGELCL